MLILCACGKDNNSRKETTVHTNPAQQEWKQKTLDYVQALNAYIDEGIRTDWANAEDEPTDGGREHLAEQALEAVREANRSGGIEQLREQWPPAHAPFIGMLNANGQSIPTVSILDDGSILARIGAPYEDGYVVRINGDHCEKLDGVGIFGRGPNRRYFAVAEEQGVRITDGWGGETVAVCPWPTGTEGVPEGYQAQPFDKPPTPTQLIPFPDGSKVLLVSAEGIFVLTPGPAHRLLPSEEAMREQFDWLKANQPDQPLSLQLSMEHGAISTDGKLIAVGSQSSTHLIFNDRYELIGDVGNLSEYPHYACFSADGSMIAFNSCHFYNGVTVGVPTSLLPGLQSEMYAEDDRLTTLEDGARVYAAVSRTDEFIIGDASGYIRAVNHAGEFQWQQFIGSSVGDIDVTPDGKTLVVSTYAGFIAIFDLDAGRQAPHQIGNGGHFEVRRWLFWKNEAEPLIW